VIEGHRLGPAPHDLGAGILCEEGAAPTIWAPELSFNSAPRGAGIGCASGARPTIRHCRIAANAAHLGGAIYSEQSSAPQLEALQITSNSASAGGAIYMADDSLSLVDCHITDNAAHGPEDEAGGGGIHRQPGSELDALGTMFARNHAEYSGGGILADGASLVLRDCDLANNGTQREGGAIAARGGAMLELSRCHLDGNIANHYGAALALRTANGVLTHSTIRNSFLYGRSGGAIFFATYHDDRTLDLENCVLQDNHADSGAGLYVFGDGTTTMRNSTIYGNHARESGGGLSISADHHAAIHNSIIWGNLPDGISDAGARMTVVFSDLQGGWPGSGNGDIDPQLRDRGGRFGLLSPASHCVDAGDPLVHDAIYDNDPRWPLWYPNGARSDMGAYAGPGNKCWRAR